MASAQDMASKVKWLLHSLTVFVKEKEEALLLPIIFYDLIFTARLEHQLPAEKRGSIPALRHSNTRLLEEDARRYFETVIIKNNQFSCR